jgi:hypothetical protein
MNDTAWNRPGRKPRWLKDAEKKNLAELLTELPPGKRIALVDAIYDRAVGIKQFLRLKKSGVRPEGILLRPLAEGEGGGEDVIEGYIYSVPPDGLAQRLLVEYNIGRPKQQETEAADKTIILRHNVPGKRDWDLSPDGLSVEPKDGPDDPPIPSDLYRELVEEGELPREGWKPGDDDGE